MDCCPSLAIVEAGLLRDYPPKRGLDCLCLCLFTVQTFPNLNKRFRSAIDSLKRFAPFFPRVEKPLSVTLSILATSHSALPSVQINGLLFWFLVAWFFVKVHEENRVAVVTCSECLRWYAFRWFGMRPLLTLRTQKPLTPNPAFKHTRRHFACFHFPRPFQCLHSITTGLTASPCDTT
jgi:hypothetical protein